MKFGRHNEAAGNRNRVLGGLEMALNLGKYNKAPVGTEYDATSTNTGFQGRGSDDYCLWIHTDEPLANGIVVTGGPAIPPDFEGSGTPGGAGIIASGGRPVGDDPFGVAAGGPGVVGYGGGYSDGVQGFGTASGAGVRAKSESGPGVAATGGYRAAGVEATGYPAVSAYGVDGGIGVIGVGSEGGGVGGSSEKGIGVNGTSSDGAGINGYSDNDRGGVFGSGNIAQLRLMPSTTPLEDNTDARSSGQPGDLYLYIVPPSEPKGQPQVTLWLCVMVAPPYGAYWQPVVLGDLYP
jgi:hypothetical protein